MTTLVEAAEHARNLTAERNLHDLAEARAGQSVLQLQVQELRLEVASLTRERQHLYREVDEARREVAKLQDRLLEKRCGGEP